ncbi:hypothetical protein V1524DRAFT_473446 [Lipomyces starkeyi]
MAHSELLATVRRPLSPDTHIEVPATRSEYERVQEILDEEYAKFLTLQYDGFRIVEAAPSPLHGDMVGQLLWRISRSVDRMPEIDQNIKDGISISNDRRNTRDTGDTSTTRNWDGALTYLTRDGGTLMVAVEVGLSQTYDSLRAAISFSVCALGCRVGIAISINEGDRDTAPTIRYYGTREEKLAGIREIEHSLDSQLQTNPFGPLRIGEETWFGKITKVVLETYRLENESSPPETLLDPKQSFFIDDCRKWAICWGREATSVNFFQQDWFENTFRFALLATAMERVRDKSKVQQV